MKTQQVVNNDLSVERQYELIKENIEEEKEKLLTWQKIFAYPEFEGMLDGLENEIEQEKEENTSLALKNEDTIKIRAKIWATRKLLGRIRSLVTGESIKIAEKSLAEFEQANGLFVANQKVKK